MSACRKFTRREVLAAGIAGGLSIAGLARQPARAQAQAAKYTIKASYNTFASMLQFFAGKEQKFFEAEGIRLEDANVNPALTMSGLLSGQYEVGFHSLLDIAQIHVKNTDIKIFHAGVIQSHQFPYSQMVVPNGSPIKTAKDLAGKRIAVALIRGAIDVSIYSMVTEVGVDPATLSLVQVGIDGVIPALSSGKFDAVYCIEPALTIAKVQKLGTALPYSGLDYMANGYIAREPWLEKNPDAARAFIRALDRSTEWLKANPKEAPGLIVRNSKLDEKLAQQIILPGPLTIARKSDMQPFLDYATKYSLLPRAVNACDLMSRICPKDGC
jgi:NitT/TauT family transport system substrate-binding protein